MNRKRFLSLLLCAALVLTLLPVTARAATVTNVPYIDENGIAQTASSAEEITSATTALAGGWYLATGTVTCNATITVTGNVHLILADGASLTVNGDGDHAGINVSGANSLTIYGQDGGTGRLEATGGHSGAGIGGGRSGNGGTVTINGGTVTANGGGYGAGIGGGYRGNGGTVTINGGTVTAKGGITGAGIGGGGAGIGGTVIINGGTVTANGSHEGAGIGGGDGGSGGTVTISGGTVTANGGISGGGSGAGIGGGSDGNGGAVTISGGTVTATGGSDAYDIGSGPNSATGGTLSLDGAARLAMANAGTNAAVTLGDCYILDSGTTSPITDGAYIDGVLFTGTVIDVTNGSITGSGAAYSSPVVTVSGSSYDYLIMGSTTSNRVVVSTGTSAATDIILFGVSINGSACAFDISGSKVNLALCGKNILRTSAIESAGLHCPVGAELTISGNGNLDATGGTYGAGIGGNIADDDINDGSGGMVTINGGAVTANGGGFGAGIGGGYGGDGGTVEISGGAVTATGKSGGAGIGGGSGGNGGTVEISGGTVRANGLEDRGAGIGSGSAVSIGQVRDGGTVTITGGSVLARGNQPIGVGQYSSGSVTPTNGIDPVYLTTLTLPGVSTPTSVPETALGLAGAAAGYGKKDLITDAGGTLYFYLPTGSASATYGGAKYAATVAQVDTNAFALLSADAALSGLTISQGTLSPVFAGDAYTYAASVGNGISSVSIAANTNESHATMTLQKGSGTAGAWDGTDSARSLDVGANVFTITVTAQDGTTTKTYTVTVTRAAAVGNSDPTYIPRTLTDSATGVTLTGSSIHELARLTVSPLALHPNDPACDAIRKAQAAKQLILGFNISLSPAANGPVTLSIPVGSQYSGKNVTILHCVNGKLETITATVVNGMATFTVKELSPFAVTTGIPVQITGVPNTGGAASPWGFLLIGLAVCAGYLVMKRRRA